MGSSVSNKPPLRCSKPNTTLRAQRSHRGQNGEETHDGDHKPPTQPRHGLLRLVATIAVLCGALGLGASEAQSQELLEVGGFMGWYGFSEDNELGVRDAANAISLGNAPILGARVGYRLIQPLWVEGELAGMPAGHSPTNTGVTVFSYRAHGLLDIPVLQADSAFEPFALLGFGANSAFSDNTSVFQDDTDTFVYGGVGFKYLTSYDWGFRLDGRLLIPPSSNDQTFKFKSLDFELLLGVFHRFGAEPPKPADSDGDGLPDDIDRCPQNPEDADGFEDNDGCPDPDNDTDGIPAKDDACIDKPETVNDFQDDDGCPEADSDGDKIFDELDQCPAKAEDADGFEDSDGCPDPDNDKDGIPDKDDACPMKPETVNKHEDDDGCPDEVPEAIKAFTGVIEGIRFRSGSDVILRQSFEILDKAADVIKAHPKLKIEIQGHTDDNGAEADNQDLSERRAKAVEKYLIDKGVPAKQLVSKGFGESKPLVPNKDDESRTINRRVEFKRID